MLRAASACLDRRSTTSSARRCSRRAVRCACWRARAPARPGPSPGASRTWWRRARRRRPGAGGDVHLSRRGRDARPAARAGRRRRCTGSVQAMTFHAAARRQLQYFWPRVVGDTGWQLLDSKFAVVAQAASRAGLQASTDDVRDLAGEIEWAKASLISPEDYPAAVAKVGRDIPLDAAQGRRGLRRLRDAQGPRATARRCWTSTTCCCTPPPRSRTTRRWPRSSATATAASSSTSTRTSRRCSSGCSTPGSASATTSPSSATPTRPSTRSPAPRRSYLLDFSRRFPDAAVVRLERDYRSTPQVVSLANRVIAAARGRVAGSKLHLIGQRDPGPEPSFAEHPDEVAEAAGGREEDQAAHRGRHAAVGDRGAVPDQRPVRGVRGGADRGRHRVPGARRRGVLQPPGDPAGAAGAAARGRARRRRVGRRTAAAGARNCSSRWG